MRKVQQRGRLTFPSHELSTFVCILLYCVSKYINETSQNNCDQSTNNTS